MLAVLRFVGSTALFSLGFVLEAGCQPRTSFCTTPALGEVTVFWETPEDGPAGRFTGTLVEIRPSDDLGFSRFSFKDDRGTMRRLKIKTPGEPLPLQVGVSYDVRVDYIPGFPSASGVSVRDADGLVYASVGDAAPNGLVMREGIPGFLATFVPPACPSRASDRCYEGIFNATVRFTHDGRSVTLYQGERARLGRYEVVCFLAQQVVYRKGCADAGLLNVSYEIRRAE